MPIQYFFYLRMVSPLHTELKFSISMVDFVAVALPSPSHVISQVIPMTQITLSLIKPSVSVREVDCFQALCSETFLHSFDVFIAFSISLKIYLQFYLVFEIII